MPVQARFCGQCGFSVPAAAPNPPPAPAPPVSPAAASKPLARTMALGSPAFPGGLPPLGDQAPMTSPSPHRPQEGPVERPAPPLMNDEETVRRDLSSVLAEIEAAEARRRAGDAPAAPAPPPAAAPPTPTPPSIPTPVVPPPNEAATINRPLPPEVRAAMTPRDLNKTFVDPSPLGARVGASQHTPPQNQLNQTVADPGAQEAARLAMAAAMAAAGMAQPRAPQGGTGPMPAMPAMAPAPAPAMAAPAMAAPATATAPEPPPTQAPPMGGPPPRSLTPSQSPLSQSVMAPPGMSPRGAMGTALGMPAVDLPSSAGSAPPPAAGRPASEAPPNPAPGRKLGTSIGLAPETPLSPKGYGGQGYGGQGYAAGPAGSAPPPGPSAPPRRLGTAIGISPEAPLGAPPEQAYPAPPAPAPQPGPQPGPKPALKTMLGVSPQDLGAPLGPPPGQQPGSPGQPGGPPQGPQGPNRTMLGVAIPGVAPTNAATSQPPGQVPPGPNRTMLGVAMPGIAPTGASAGAPMGGPPIQTSGPWQSAAIPAVLPRPAMPEDEAPPEAPAVPARSGVPIVAVIGILALVLAIGGVIIAVMILRAPQLVARPELDDQGKEALRIQCDACADGVTVAIGAQTGTVKGHTALVTLPEPLTVGDNRITVKLQRSGKAEEVKVTVPVAYRIRADLTTLAAQPAVITVRVEAAAGAQASVEGKPVTIDATGKGSYAIDVSKDTQGPSDETKVIDKKIAFVITPRGGKPETGTLTAKTGIVPLHVDAPLAHTTVAEDAVTVAGQTAPGSTVTLDGKPVAVDEKGAFVHSEKLLHDGETTFELVSQMGQLAPRSTKVTVRRVASLDALAKELDGQSPLAFSAFASDPAGSAGKLAAIEGEVVELRPSASQSIVLVDAKKGCDRAECLVRVVVAGDAKLAKKDVVRVYGRPTKAVTSGGKSVPEVEADFWVKRR